MMKSVRTTTTLAGLVLPVVGHAQSTPDLGYLVGAVAAVSDIVSSLIPLAVAIALIVFMWSVVKFIANAGDDEARKSGLRQMAWGIVGLFAIVSVWGIVSLLASMVGIDQTTAAVLPAIPL